MKRLLEPRFRRRRGLVFIVDGKAIIQKLPIHGLKRILTFSSSFRIHWTNVSLRGFGIWPLTLKKQGGENDEHYQGCGKMSYL